MAISHSLTILIFVLASLALTARAQNINQISSAKRVEKRTEVITAPQFYFHRKIRGQNPIAVEIAQAARTDKSSTFFGTVTDLSLWFWYSIQDLWVKPEPEQDHHNRPQEKLTTLQVYVQDVIAGPNATVVTVAQGSSTLTSPTLFGMVSVLDDAVRTGPNTSYPILGRAQGLYVSSSLEETSIHMTFDLVFTSGPYNGSTLNLAGHNAYLRDYRELAVVGGTGAFRFSRGFVGVSTVSRNNVTGDAFFQYNVTVFFEWESKFPLTFNPLNPSDLDLNVSNVLNICVVVLYQLLSSC